MSTYCQRGARPVGRDRGGGASGTGGAAIGGGINVIVTGSDVQATVGDNTTITANGLFKVDASNTSDLTLISTSLAGSTGGAAVGGTVAVIVAENQTLASVGAAAQVAAGDVLVQAVSEERLLNVLASLSGAAGSSPTVAGTIGTLVSTSETRAEVGNGARLLATSGSVTPLTPMARLSKWSFSQPRPAVPAARRWALR